MTRLKVRQWTQMLVDHSLLLGSSSEGIHLHDIVLQYLRKRLSVEELRLEQRKVVSGMVAAAQMRLTATGRGLQETGTSERPVRFYRYGLTPHFLTGMVYLCSSSSVKVSGISV